MTLPEKIIALKLKYPKTNIDTKIKDFLLVHTKEEMEKKITNILTDNNDNWIPSSFYTLRVGYECNNFCIHCFVEDKRYSGGDKTYNEIIDIIDSIKDKNTLIIITGGEPTIRKDIIDILKYIDLKGFKNSIQTNGLKFHDIDFLYTMKPYIGSIVLPVHSSDEIIFDKITRVPGSYNKIIKGFKNLKKLNIRTTTQTVINQLNYKTLLSTYDLIQDIAPGIGMTLTFPHPVGAADNIEVVPKLSDIKEYIQPVLKKYGHLMHTHYIPRCLLYPFHSDITIIDDTDDGNTFKPGIDYINGEWKHMDYGKFGNNTRVKSIECKKCFFNDECVGIWAEYANLYPNINEELIPIIK